MSLKYRKRSDELSSRLGIECVENKIQRARLRWFGHVERKEENDWIKKCTRMNVTGVVGRDAPRKTWRSCVGRDMKAMGIKERMVQDRCAWRNISGVGPMLARMPDIPCAWACTEVFVGGANLFRGEQMSVF